MIYQVGDTLGGCKLLKKCGSGAFGSVFLAENLTTHQNYALKILYKQGNHFERELAGLTAYQEKCRHANLMRIYHVDQNDECIFYTMDAADNQNGADNYIPDTLGNRLRSRKRLNASELIPILDELLNGLEILHHAGLMHRDIKPDNILWVNGHAVLGDIGLVVLQDGTASMAGTPGFISPEVWNNKREFASRDDLYALAMTLYCALSGCAPKEYPEIPLSLTLGGACNLIRAYNAVLAPDSTIQTVADWRKLESKPSKSGTIPPCVYWGAGILLAVFICAGTALCFRAIQPTSMNITHGNTPRQIQKKKSYSAHVIHTKKVTDDLTRALTMEWEESCRERIRSAQKTFVPIMNLSQGENSQKSFAERQRDADYEASLRVNEELKKIDAERACISILRQLAELLVRHFSDVLDDHEPKLAETLRHQTETFDRLKLGRNMDRQYGMHRVHTDYLGLPKTNVEWVKIYENALSQLPESEQSLLKRRALYLALRSSCLEPSYLMSCENAESQLRQWDQMLQQSPEK